MTYIKTKFRPESRFFCGTTTLFQQTHLGGHCYPLTTPRWSNGLALKGLEQMQKDYNPGGFRSGAK